jgi:WD repeat-containing protein 68
MNQPQPYGAPRRTGTYGTAHDELHMSPTASQQAQISSRDFTTAPGPQIKLDQAVSQPVTPGSHYSQGNSNSVVPNVLQPAGGLGATRPHVMSANTAPTLPTMPGGLPQQQSPADYSSPSKPPSLNVSSHGYSRSSPAAPYESPSGYTSYTPTTPGGSIAGPSQLMSTPDSKHGAPGSQRNISNTPLGLADIRPRADSSLSDGAPGTQGYEFANAQPSPSNYLAPWALYAFDWCKWAPTGTGAGKVAIGSYLEDGHNFVSIAQSITRGRACHWGKPALISLRNRFKFLIPRLLIPLPMFTSRDRPRAASSLPRSPRPHTRIP